MHSDKMSFFQRNMTAVRALVGAIMLAIVCSAIIMIWLCNSFGYDVVTGVAASFGNTNAIINENLTCSEPTCDYTVVMPLFATQFEAIKGSPNISDSDKLSLLKKNCNNRNSYMKNWENGYSLVISTGIHVFQDPREWEGRQLAYSDNAPAIKSVLDKQCSAEYTHSSVYIVLTNGQSPKISCGNSATCNYATMLQALYNQEFEINSAVGFIGSEKRDLIRKNLSNQWTLIDNWYKSIELSMDEKEAFYGPRFCNEGGRGYHCKKFPGKSYCEKNPKKCESYHDLGIALRKQNSQLNSDTEFKSEKITSIPKNDRRTKEVSCHMSRNCSYHQLLGIELIYPQSLDAYSALPPPCNGWCDRSNDILFKPVHDRPYGSGGGGGHHSSSDYGYAYQSLIVNYY